MKPIHNLREKLVPKRILIVEDDPGIQDSYQILFELEGYEVQVSQDCGSQPDESNFLPDVILLDRQLASKDGLDICRQLKANEATMHIPIIIISATFNLGKQALEAGAEAFLEKPISIHKLRETVSYWANGQK